MDPDAIPDVSTMSEASLRRLFEHMRLNFPGTLMTALKEIEGCGDDSASHKTQKTSNTREHYERRVLHELGTIPDEGTPSPDRTMLNRNTSDVDGGDQPPSVPSRPGAETDPEKPPPLESKLADQDGPQVIPPDDVPLPIPQLITSASKQMSTGDLKPIIPTRPAAKFASTLQTPASEQEGCYLYYDSDGGKLMIQYSATQVPNALGFWSPGEDKKIPPFKFKQNQGRSELIKNCQSGLAGRKNFYSGWCQFIRAARAMNATVTLLAPTGEKSGLFVDVFLYLEEDWNGKQTIKLQEDIPFEMSMPIKAVACLPKHTPFFEAMHVVLNQWVEEGSNKGAASSF